MRVGGGSFKLRKGKKRVDEVAFDDRRRYRARENCDVRTVQRSSREREDCSCSRLSHLVPNCLQRVSVCWGWSVCAGPPAGEQAETRVSLTFSVVRKRSEEKSPPLPFNDAKDVIAHRLLDN